MKHCVSLALAAIVGTASSSARQPDQWLRQSREPIDLLYAHIAESLKFLGEYVDD